MGRAVLGYVKRKVQAAEGKHYDYLVRIKYFQELRR